MQPPVRVGVFLDPAADAYAGTLTVVDAAERGGLDLVGVQDHPYQRRHLDAFALLGAVLARTERLVAFPDVANLPLRPPAVLAQTAASLDVMSGGRFELGLGAGGFPAAVAAMGGPLRSRPDARAALAEAIDVVRLMWSGERSVRFAGEHYRLDGVKPGPVPAHPIGIWLGVNGPRALELLGRAADGWVPSSSFVPPDELTARHARIDDAASAAGRDPRSIRRVYNVFGVLTGASGPSTGFLQGPVERWVDDLVEVVLGGRMDTVVVATSRGPEAAMPPVRQVEVLAAEVAPAVRAAVADELG